MNSIIIILLTLLLSSFFSGMEIAFVASNKLRIELDKKQGLFSSRFISIFSQHPGKYITTMLVGNNIALVIYGLFMAKILEPLLINIISSEIGILLIQTVLSTFIILFAAEFLPKTLVRINPNLALNIFAFPVYFFYIFFFPLTNAIIWLVNLILKKFLNTPTFNHKKRDVFSKIDLYHLITENNKEEENRDSGNNELKLFQNALEFSNVKLRECMIPRTEIVALEVNSSIEDLKQKFIETGYSKILIYEESVDNIIGYITSKELFNQPKKIKPYLIAIFFVPETMVANNLLQKLIQEHKSMAIVVDEFGGISGLVTIEDIIEEIFGEIEDEHDNIELTEKQINDNEYLFSGRLEIDYINEKYKLNIPESEEYETLAGYIIYHFESIPKMNERIIINQIEFKILKVSKTKIELIHMWILES